MSVLIVGVGCVSALGTSVDEHLQSFEMKRNGLGEVTLFQSKLQLPVAEVKKTNTELKNELGISVEKVFSRTALLGMLAAKQAYNDAQIKRQDLRIGIISASSVGGMDLSERFYTEFLIDNKIANIRNFAHHDVGDHTECIADYLKINGFRTSVSTACSSAANAILLGSRMIEQDLLDVVIAGGADALCKFTLNGFNSLMILDNKPCRPFDESRSGLNLGEGAGYVVLQSKKTLSRTVKVYAQLTGYANANDAFHQTASSPEGEGAFLAMKYALQKAGINPSDVDYINAHGTGTVNNDLSESIAIKRLFGNKVPMFSSTKAFTGHTLGAAGGLEAVFSVLAIYRNVVYPNLYFQNPIAETQLIPVTDFLENQSICTVVSNSFGFGGHNTSLIFQQFPGHV